MCTQLRYWTVDGAIFAQPLYVPDLVVNGSILNLVFAATENSSVYAFNSESGDLIWRKNFVGDGPIYPTDFDPPCYDVAPEWGITSTPYIDPDSQTLYVVPWTKEGGKFVYRIHALDLVSGAEKLGGPSPPLSATKTFSDGSTAKFDAEQQVFSMPCTDPGMGPGIWQGGAGPVIFNGSMYLVMGNGAFDPSRGAYGDSIIRVSLPELKVVDCFTPSDEDYLDSTDLDLGSAAAIPVKGKYVFTEGKEGAYYLLKADALGAFNKDNNNGNAWQTIPSDASSGDKSVSIGIGGIYSGAAYWPAGLGQVYLHGVRTGTPLRKYSFDSSDKLSLTASSAVVGNFSKRASVPIVSAVSENATEAVVWEIDASDTLYAWNAANLAPLWNSSAHADRADCKNLVKFATPTIAGGKVFMGCGSKLVAYGPK
ncbi:hypothetical protein WJX75_009444 [Coccomyxa subellipsoidea]|uniref:Pyrrolo-quinoline quinone n=1 Tax=Coccomyxa subellipsoidea TaxID=248742 RepID=A0ABR2YDC6_9CHLO